MNRLKNSTTVYVDNMSFYTAEEQVHFLFSQVGLVKKVIMGLNRYTFRPAGFCFVEYAIIDVIWFIFLTCLQVLSEAARYRCCVLLQWSNAG